MLLNIIHPYVFKLIGDTLNIGPIEEFVDRDTKVKTLVEKVQKSGGKVLLHNYSDGNLIREVMHKSAFYEDPLFSFLFEEDIEKVTTTPYGVPILDKKPANIKENDWNVLLGIYTKHSELRIKTEGHETIAFIGGALERCLANAAIYFAKNYRTNGQKIFYVPELCVSFGEKGEALVKLAENGIETMKYEDALHLN